MEGKEKLLMKTGARLYRMGIEVEAARNHLKKLVAKGTPYDSPEMIIALQKYQSVNHTWMELEQEYLRLKRNTISD